MDERKFKLNRAFEHFSVSFFWQQPATVLFLSSLKSVFDQRRPPAATGKFIKMEGRDRLCDPPATLKFFQKVLNPDPQMRRR